MLAVGTRFGTSSGHGLSAEDREQLARHQVAGPRLQALVDQVQFPEPVPDGVASRVICLPLDDPVATPRHSRSSWNRRTA